jgi:hypothetical protein
MRMRCVQREGGRVCKCDSELKSDLCFGRRCSSAWEKVVVVVVGFGDMLVMISIARNLGCVRRIVFVRDDCGYSFLLMIHVNWE